MNTIWFTVRGAGLSALVLLTVSTCLGALVFGQREPGRRPSWSQYVHRAAGGLGLGVLVLHLATVLVDSYAGVGWLGALIPSQSGYRPTWIALGTLAAYMFIAVSALGWPAGGCRSAPGPGCGAALHGLAYGGWGMADAARLQHRDGQLGRLGAGALPRAAPLSYSGR